MKKMTPKDIDIKVVEAKIGEFKTTDLSKEQLKQMLTIYIKALEIACEDINSEWRVSGDEEPEPFVKVEPAVDVRHLEMYYIDQANEFYAKNKKIMGGE